MSPSFSGILHDEGVEEMSSEVPGSSDHEASERLRQPWGCICAVSCQSYNMPQWKLQAWLLGVCVCVCTCVLVPAMDGMEQCCCGELWYGYRVCVSKCVCSFLCMFSGGWAVCVYVRACGCVCAH